MNETILVIILFAATALVVIIGVALAFHYQRVPYIKYLLSGASNAVSFLWPVPITYYFITGLGSNYIAIPFQVSSSLNFSPAKLLAMVSTMSLFFILLLYDIIKQKQEPIKQKRKGMKHSK